MVRQLLASTNYSMKHTCRECGEGFEEGYGENIFCSRGCCNRHNARRQLMSAERLARLSRMRLLAYRSYRASGAGLCRFCNKYCKSERSLSNHERLCKNNPARCLPARLKGLHQNQLHPKLEYSCKFCQKVWLTTSSGWKTPELRCLDNPERKPAPMRGRKHSEATIAKLKSIIASKDEPTGGWIGLRKRSFAEQYWFDIFSRDGLDSQLVNNYRVGKYILDFANLQSKTYFEVDGETHYTENGILHDKLRTHYLLARGWMLVGRCRWKDFVQRDSRSKAIYVQEIEQKLCGLVAKVVE